MTGALTIDELAAASGQPIARLREWEAIGLIAQEGGTFSLEALERVRLIAFAADRGIAPEAIAKASRERGDVLAHYMELAGPTQVRVGTSVEQAAEDAGIDVELVKRLLIASGLAEQGALYDEDGEMLRMLAMALAAGLPADALLQLVRVYNDSLTRVAEAENRLFHFYVHDRLKSEGLTGADLDAATAAVSEPLRDLIDPVVLYFHRKAFQRALRDDMVVHLAEEVGHDTEAVGAVAVTVLFVDLASFTVMTEVMGDATAVAVVERFSDIVREAAGACDGRVLKQIGDEFMLVFREEQHALSAGLAVMERVGAEPQFPDVRLGAHAGTALYREGDYFGATVNIAARVASQATRGQFLVTAAVAEAAQDDANISFVSAGRRDLKNVASPVALFEVRAAVTMLRQVDPVCGMSIDADSCTVRLRWEDEALCFCSDECRERFLAAPDRYRPSRPQAAR